MKKPIAASQPNCVTSASSQITRFSRGTINILDALKTGTLPSHITSAVTFHRRESDGPSRPKYHAQTTTTGMAAPINTAPPGPAGPCSANKCVIATLSPQNSIPVTVALSNGPAQNI
ncbi:hypothetical protein EBZ80_24920 [bacterium]|nr:hypothetical protein [bacterium]